MKKIIILSLLLTITLLFAANATKWIKYTCDKLPEEFGFKATGNGVSQVEIVDDPDISKNKILKFESEEPSAQWQYSIKPVDALTIVFRAKSIIAAINSWEIEWKADNGCERIYATPLMVVVNKAGEKIDMVENGKWHIWRVTMTFADKKVTTTIYKDEDPTPIAENLVSTSSNSSNTLRFGDGSSSQFFSAYYDWIVWTTDGALDPKKGKLPRSLRLTGLN